MISKQATIFAGIAEACPQARVWMDYPASWTSVPCVAVYESANAEYARADGDEYLTEIHYTIDIWAETGAEAFLLADAANGVMQKAGFRRESCTDMFEEKTRYRRRNMRYRAVFDRAGRIYQ